MQSYPKSLSKRLVKAELFDLTLYKKISKFSKGETKELLLHLALMEEGHLQFWEEFFNMKNVRLNLLERFRLRLLTLFCRITGEPGTHLVLEAIEVFGIKKYLSVWEFYKDDELGSAVRTVLEEEFLHESNIVEQTIKRKIHPERVRNIFLGLNDGLVEIIGAVSGFFAAFQAITSVLIAGVTVAVAGAISMAAGAYVAVSSEQEVEKTSRAKRKFLGQDNGKGSGPSSFAAAISVGASYIVGALVPLIPILLGAETILIPVIAAGFVLIIISYVLSFLSGMDPWNRILLNIIVLAAAVLITYSIGLLTKEFFGILI